MNSEEFYKAINGDYLNTLNRLGNEQKRRNTNEYSKFGK